VFSKPSLPVRPFDKLTAGKLIPRQARDDPESKVEGPPNQAIDSGIRLSGAHPSAVARLRKAGVHVAAGFQSFIGHFPLPPSASPISDASRGGVTNNLSPCEQKPARASVAIGWRAVLLIIMRCADLFLFVACFPLLISAAGQPSVSAVKPDITVAADGSGDFQTVQQAIDSIPRDNRQRVIVLVKDGVYREKVRVDADCITVRGQSRRGTRIEFTQGADEFRSQPDSLGIGVVNINGDDFVLENLTVRNKHGVIGVHAFAVYGRGDRTVIVDSDILSEGNDTLSLWRASDRPSERGPANPARGHPNGRYYHARLSVRGSVDFICPRGWCYMTDCDLYEVNTRAEAAIWHDGSRDPDMKFVLRNCRLDGVEGWRLARHHHDAQFFLLDCMFSKAMRDHPPHRVIYPLAGRQPTEADLTRNKELDATNVWGERFYYHNCHRDGADYAWHQDNLASAPGAPKPAQITAAWTFAGEWDPENAAGPTVQKVSARENQIELTFSERVTVKGRPRLVLGSGDRADFVSGSGGDTLVFAAPAGSHGAAVRLDFQDGVIIATQAAATLRMAGVNLR
jgi:pectinesterase